MTSERLIRDYENPNLPLERRLPSLARRFACLRHAEGLDPWSAEQFHAWIMRTGEGSTAWHAGHLVLNLKGDGPWARFDAVAAVRVWDEGSRNVFATWARTWR